MRRGFTLIELALVISLLGLLTPLGYALYRSLEADHAAVVARIDAAREARAVSETLRRDLWMGALRPEALVIDHPECGEIQYRVEAGRLVRRASPPCGGTTVVAAHVARMGRSAGRLLVELEWRLTGERSAKSTIVIGLPERAR